jgi:O-antigen/teichoic acid export membrane protein
MTDNRRIAKNTMFLYIRMILVMLVGLYTSRVVLKTLGVEDYGLYNVVGGVVTMFTYLNASLSAATSRFIILDLGREDYEHLGKVFNITFLIHIGMAVFIILLAETVGLWFFYNKMVIPQERLGAAFWVYQFSVLTAFFSITQCPYNAEIIAHEDFSIYAWIGIVTAFLKLGVVFLLLISPIDKLIFYALMLCIVQIGTMIFYRAYCDRRFPECKLKRINFKKENNLVKGIFSYAGWEFIGDSVGFAQGQGLNILLNMFFGPVVNAAYGIVSQVQSAIVQLSNNFMSAVRPQIIKQYAVNKINDMMTLVKRSSSFSYYLMWLISLPICLETDYLLTLWLGEYPDHTKTFLHLVIVLCLLQTLMTPRSIAFQATGKIKLTNIVVGSLMFAALPAAYVALKLGASPESVFICAVTANVIAGIINIFILRRYIEFSIKDYLLSVHLRCIIVTVVSFTISYFLFDRFMEPSFLRLVITCVITTLSIGLSSLYLGMDKDTRQKLVGMFLSKLKKNK